MDNLSPRRISLLLTFFVWLIMAVICFTAFYLEELSLILVVFGLLLAFLFIFIITYTIINRFVYEKIKVIYRTIHQLKVDKGGMSTEVKLKRSDLLGQVSTDVVEWAKDSSEELEQLRSLENYRKEFIGNVSHELKTPIFNIQGYILTLLDGGLEDPSINREYLQRAERSVNRMITIVEDLETITRFESGQLHLDKEPFDLVRLVKEVIESEELKASKKGIRLSLNKKHDKPVRVYADKEKIRQVITNLVINSIKYGRDNGSTEIQFFDMDENILVEVTDDGVGIDEKHLSRLFERFYRVDPSRSRAQGGSGLGLAIVKHIIEAHQQTISVQSKKGIGSTFSFTLRKAR